MAILSCCLCLPTGLTVFAKAKGCSKAVNTHIISDSLIYLCNGSCVTLGTEDEYKTYLWSTGEAKRYISLQDSGKYWITVTDAKGVTYSDTVWVVAVDNPLANILIKTPPFICHGDSIILYADSEVPGVSFIWSTGQHSDSICVKKPGTFYLIAYNEHNCMDTATIVISQGHVPPVTISPRDTVVCSGESVVFTVLEDYAEYEWLGKTKSRDLTASDTGWYYVIVKDTSECHGIDSVHLGNYDLRISGLDKDIDFDSVCTGELSEIIITVKNKSNTGILLDLPNYSSADSTFIYMADKAMPVSLIPEGELELLLRFLPGDAAFYDDTLRVKVISPCPRDYKVYLKGAGIAKTLVWFPDTSGKVGDRGFVIPLNMRLECGKYVPSVNNFSANISIDDGVFAADTVLGVELAGIDIKDFCTNLFINGNKVITDISESRIAEIKGNILMGYSYNVSLSIDSMKWQNPYIIPIIQNGKLSVNELCVDSLCHLEMLDRAFASIFPNPVHDISTLRIDGVKKGLIQYNLYTLLGEKIKSASFEKKEGDNSEHIINFEGIPSGVYDLQIITPGGVLTESVIVY